MVALMISPLFLMIDYRCQRAHCACPSIGIHDRAFDLVRDNLIMLKYDGPVGLSCDDTKLMAAFHPYYDQKHDAHFILGNTGEPYQLIDPDAFQNVLDSGILEKAMKVCVIDFPGSVITM